MGDVSEREVTLLQSRQEAQGRRLDGVEQQQRELDDRQDEQDKAMAVLLVQFTSLVSSFKGVKALLAFVGSGVILAAISIVLFGGPR